MPSAQRPVGGGRPPRLGLPRAAVLVLPLLVVAIVVAVVVGRGATSSKASPRTPSPTPVDVASQRCRAQWTDVATSMKGRDESTEPSGLATRWKALIATADYYTTSARPSDCGSALDDAKKSVTDLQAFSAQLVGFDVPHQLAQVTQSAQAYAAGPAPAPSKKGTAKAKPTPKAVGAALTALGTSAPAATQQQDPGWQQAQAVDLGDAAAVSKAVKDLAFLSQDSPAYVSSQQQLALIHRAVG